MTLFAPGWSTPAMAAGGDSYPQLSVNSARRNRAPSSRRLSSAACSSVAGSAAGCLMAHMLPRLAKPRIAVLAAGLGFAACSSGGSPPTIKASTVVTAGAELPSGSDSCARPTLISSTGTSSGATGGNTDKHGSNTLGYVAGAGAPDVVWRVVLAKNGRLTVRSNGMGHFVAQLVIAYAPDYKGAPFKGTPAPPCGAPAADKVAADNLTRSVQHRDFSMTLTADLKAGPYLVWLDGDGARDAKDGNYQVGFDFG